MVIFAPAFWADGGFGETLRIDTGIYLGPVFEPTFSCLLPEVLVVYDPAWPTILKAALGY